MSKTATPPAENAVAKRTFDYTRPTNASGLQAMGREIIPQIKAALPTFMKDNAERCIRALLTECARSPRLLDCTPRSLLGGVIVAAQLGLELGGPMGQAYLIPFKQEAALIPGYKGLIALAYRSQIVRRITPETVRKGDTFKIVRGSDQKIIHEPDPSYEGEATGYYTVIELTNGGTDFEYITKKQAERHRDRFALAKNGGPWKTDFDAMAEKTTIRMIGKRIPLSTDWQRAINLEEMTEVGESQYLASHVGSIVGGQDQDAASQLQERLDKEKESPKDGGDDYSSPDHRPEDLFDGDGGDGRGLPD